MTPAKPRRKTKKPPARKRRPSPLLHDSGEHTIPTPLAERLLSGFLVVRPEHEERMIREYVEIQGRPAKVRHLEKVKTERIGTRALDAWDVRTTQGRYWVITDPTNLYAQKDFPSLDFTISFHVGLAARIFARQPAPVPEAEHHRLIKAWRRLEQASKALDNADEAEDFQAVGMRCRECLLDFIAVTAKPEMVSEGQPQPQQGNFLDWAEIVANAVARGSSAERVRHYLKGIADETWQLVSWLTHARNATHADGRLSIDATQNVLAAFGAAVMRYETGAPDRCPRCSSYRMTIDFRSDIMAEIPLCESCGWTGPEHREGHPPPAS
jgi:predicted RNA-binding Zn-ribbon protein involved in translation (DUF1610 family)